MSSWACPHLDEKSDYCQRLKTECVPGRRGCVLPTNLKFAVPPEQRTRAAGPRCTGSNNLSGHAQCGWEGLQSPKGLKPHGPL
jgi:hypothetical protein